MKRLIVCCDGTWQSLDNSWPTNVQRMAQLVQPTDARNPDQQIKQIVYYDSGVGTRGLLDKMTGGAFGHGLDIEVREAYRFLCLNYEDGDEIYLFGFSRGAYTVRSLAGLIYSCGLVRRTKLNSIPRAVELYRDRTIRPDHDECVHFRMDCGLFSDDDRPDIQFLGCWDTVGSLGIPDALPWLPIDEWVGDKYKFHDMELGPHIRHARHAVAIEEDRKVFNVTGMTRTDNQYRTAAGETFDQVLKQVWFPGDHGSVGGGEREKRGLSDCALKWMMDEAGSVGLAFNDHPGYLDDFVRPDPLTPFPEEKSGILNSFLSPKKPRDITDEFDAISPEAKERWRKSREEGKTYLPDSLKKFEPQLIDWAAALPTDE